MIAGVVSWFAAAYRSEVSTFDSPSVPSSLGATVGNNVGTTIGNGERIDTRVRESEKRRENIEITDIT